MVFKKLYLFQIKFFVSRLHRKLTTRVISGFVFIQLRQTCEVYRFNFCDISDVWFPADGRKRKHEPPVASQPDKRDHLVDGTTQGADLLPAGGHGCTLIGCQVCRSGTLRSTRSDRCFGTGSTGFLLIWRQTTCLCFCAGKASTWS